MPEPTAGNRSADSPPEKAARASAPAMEEDAGRFSWRAIWPWLLRASVAGVAVSIIIHITLAIIAGLIFVERPTGIRGASSVEVEFAVITEAQLTQLREEALSSEPVKMEDLRSLDALPSSAMESPNLDPTPLGMDLGEISPLGGAGSGLGQGEGDGLGLSGGGGGAAAFFGVEARGSRFAYIVDTSGSMGGPKIAALQRELISSVAGLLEHTSFAIFFYSDQVRWLGSRPRWIGANDQARQWAAREIRAVPPFGGTQPLPAFEAAFAMKPRPDAIYFMTDGLFGAEVAPAVAALNARGATKTPIHCISFVSRESEDLLRQIARESDGSYTHISDPNLK